MMEIFENSCNEGCMPKPTIRRSGNHHPNLWSDDFIQSLSSPYGDSSYSKHREILINELHAIFSTQKEEFSLLERISFVDVLQRLGINRYFQEEINMALDYIHKYWNHNIIGDLNMTALGFRILRVNRYVVSSDVFQKFKGEGGQFSGFGSSHVDEKLAIMLNLYKASELDFLDEKILKEARDFAFSYLQQAMEQYDDVKEKENPLLMEIEYSLKYAWRTRVPRWEAWNFIQIFRKQSCNGSFVKNIYKIPNTYSQKLLELAILDFNILQAQHQSEMKLISTWWKHSSVIQLDFFRHRHIEFYFWWDCSIFEPEYSTTRIGLAKFLTTLSLIDDIYDTYGTIDELRPFTTALIRWDISMIDNLPDYMKTSFQFTHEIHKEIASEAERKHGPFVHKYIQSCWKSYISAYMQEAEWIASNHKPGFDEYLINGVISAGMRITMIYALLLTNAPLSDEIMEKLDIPSSRLQALVSLTTRLLDDIKDFEDEKARGETASSIECYIKDNPSSTTEDALNYVTNHIESCVQELNQEFLKPSDIPDYCRKVYFNGGIRGIFFLFKDVDGFTFSHQKEIRDAITKILMEPIMP
ncbi:sesquiterpene synthase Cad isoform X1 [Cryptomeria japonica]|uniref:sesquiterpene synthase Cad isoform X1 n=1 Tax=Cryptomeria japonica TaxID=3369 RepID=UPI0025ABA116|nr:sesquiterpene synthase Cad isoform X1 [Cryptomeria japonica]